MPRYFTLDDARGYLPAVNLAVREGIVARRNLDLAEKDHDARRERIMFSGGMSVDQEAAQQTREKRDSSSAKLKQLLRAFDEIGCVVKDLDVGLIDFPALYRGKEVYLCWRLGEADIAFWHGVEEGFAGRRPIDAEFLRECRGDSQT
jgi:hypothetical protein